MDANLSLSGVSNFNIKNPSSFRNGTIDEFKLFVDAAQSPELPQLQEILETQRLEQIESDRRKEEEAKELENQAKANKKGMLV